MILAKTLADLDGVQHRFFTRQGGVSSGLYSSLNCGYGSGDQPENVRENRRRVAEHFGLDEKVGMSFGTLSKSFGGVGGFICSNARIIRLRKPQKFMDTSVSPGRSMYVSPSVV